MGGRGPRSRALRCGRTVDRDPIRADRGPSRACRVSASPTSRSTSSTTPTSPRRRRARSTPTTHCVPRDVCTPRMPPSAPTCSPHGPFGTKPSRRPRSAATSSRTCCATTRRVKPNGMPGTTNSTYPTCSRAALSARCLVGCARRAPVGPNFLTLYDVATDTVDEAVQRSAVTLAEIVAAGRKHETHAGALTVTLQPGWALWRRGLPPESGP